MKSGYRTTEFATVVATLLVSVLVLCGAIGPGEEEEARGMIEELVLAVGTLLTNAAVVVSYVRSRTALKRDGQESACGRSATRR